MTEMRIPTKYADDIDQLRNGPHGWHGLRHCLAWALMPADMREAWTVGFLTETNPGSILEACVDAVLAAMADEEDRG